MDTVTKVQAVVVSWNSNIWRLLESKSWNCKLSKRMVSTNAISLDSFSCYMLLLSEEKLDP